MDIKFRKKEWLEGQPCDHPGCLSYISHPCGGCGRIGGKEPDIEQVTLWMEGEPKLFVRIAEVVSKEPVFVVKMLYSDIMAKVIRREINSRYHCFRISSELSDQATTFWPYQFWLLSARATPEIVAEGEGQWMYLRFRVEDFPRKMDFDLITCGPWDTYSSLRSTGVKGRYEPDG